MAAVILDRKSTRLNSSHTEIYTLSLHTLFRSLVANFEPAMHQPRLVLLATDRHARRRIAVGHGGGDLRSEEHTSELQSHRDLHSFPTHALPISGRQLRASNASATSCTSRH